MPTEFSVLEGEYLRDILDQPRALERTLAGLEDPQTLTQPKRCLHEGRFKTVVLTGMGASFHALHPLHLGLIDHGLTSVMAETSELVHYQQRLLNGENLVVAVSQSGQSAEAIRLLEANRGRSSIIAITNTPGSPLAEQADATIMTQAGEESSVSCKTYIAGLMALECLEDVFCERDSHETLQDLKRAIRAVQSYLTNWTDHVQDLTQLLEGIRHLFLVGRGSSLATVGTGALIVKESDHFQAEGMSSAAFRHGPFEMLGEETFVLVFAGDTRTRDLNRRLSEDIRAKGGRAELVVEGAAFAPCVLPEVPERVRPIVEILPVQMITLALAAHAGREPGRFQLASKVTTTE